MLCALQSIQVSEPVKLGSMPCYAMLCYAMLWEGSMAGKCQHSVQLKLVPAKPVAQHNHHATKTLSRQHRCSLRRLTAHRPALQMKLFPRTGLHFSICKAPDQPLECEAAQPRQTSATSC